MNRKNEERPKRKETRPQAENSTKSREEQRLQEQIAELERTKDFDLS